jgi:translation initiation factor 1A
MGEFDDEPTEDTPEAVAEVAAGEEGVVRVKLPRGKETLGLLDRRLGGSRCEVRCLDGKTRICRIPGRLKRKLWVREGDLVLVEPWEFGGDEKGDIIYKYRGLQVDWLKKNGYLDKLKELDDF